MTMELLAKEFVFDCQARELAPRTIRNYEKQISYFLRYLEEVHGVKDLEELRPIHIKQYVVMLSGIRMKPTYINDLLKAVKCLCAYACGEGYTEDLIPPGPFPGAMWQTAVVLIGTSNIRLFEIGVKQRWLSDAE